MVASDIGRNFAEGFLLVAKWWRLVYEFGLELLKVEYVGAAQLERNMLNTVTIDNLVVPELVQMGNSSGAVLDCQFTAADDRFTLQWLFNRGDEPVYEWSPGVLPKASGILEGRLDREFKISNASMEEGRALRIVRLDPELSGEYTCRVLSDGGEAHRTKAMLVFSPERDFVLDVHHLEHHDTVDVKCSAHGLYPQPDLTLEYNNELIPAQHQRVWRSEGVLYSAVSSARLRARGGRAACRLRLPPAGYTALRTHLLTSQKNHDTHDNIIAKESGEVQRPNRAPTDSKTRSVYALIILSVAITDLINV